MLAILRAVLVAVCKGRMSVLLVGVLSYAGHVYAQVDASKRQTSPAEARGGSSASGAVVGDNVRLDVTWRHALGSGYSAVAVGDGLAVTSFSDSKSDVVVAFSAADGREKWRYKLDEAYKGHDGSQDGPLSTPAIANGRVFALAPRGKLFALDASSGREIWKSDLVAEHGGVKPHYGFTTSPLMADGVLIVQIGGKEGMVLGLDPDSGKRLWIAGNDSVNYQSPVLHRDGAQTQVLVSGDKKLLGLDPRSGKVLWEHAHGGEGEHGAPCMIPLVLDSSRIFLKHQDDRSQSIEIVSRDGGASIQSLWESASISKTYSPAVAVDGYLYGFNRRALTCVDAKTGEPAWRSREPGDGFVSTVDGRLIIVTKEGSVHLAKASPQGYQELAKLDVFKDLCWSPPTVADGSVFVRSLGEIARIDIRPGASPTEATRDPGLDLAGTSFGKFLDQLRGADDKATSIDQFLKSTSQFPIVESDGRVVFVYRGPAKHVELGGDVTGFGATKPLNRVADTDLFYCVERMEPDARVGYAFLRDFHAVLDPLNPRKLVNKWFDEALELAFGKPGQELSWFAMPKWRPPSHIAVAAESRRGRVVPQKFKSETLGADVELEVYTPIGYEQAATPFPVVYIHDGRMVRDELQMVNALDNLIGSRIAPIIAVFIRHRPPLFSSPDQYAEMAAKEIPAFVDSKYRTISRPDARAHIGFGMSGHATFVTVLAHLDQATRVGVQSPFMTGGELDSVMPEASRAPLTVYFSWCKYDLRNTLEGWSTVLAGRGIDQLFRTHGHRPTGGEIHEGSDPESWRNRTDDMLEALFPLNTDN